MKRRDKTLRGLSIGQSDDLGRQLIAAIAENLIADGTIDPKGKDAEEIALEAAAVYLKEFRGLEVVFSTSYKDQILNTATMFRRKGLFEESCLFYATWFEHWVNYILIKSGVRLQEDERIQMIRDAPIRAKFTWLLKLLGFPAIAPTHLKQIFQACEYRNSFVHYKWKGRTEAEDEVLKTKQKNLFGGIANTVRYLKKVEDRHMFKGSKKILGQIAPKQMKKK